MQGDKLTVTELIYKLNQIKNDFTGVTEEGHIAADEALLEFIGEPAITKLYNEILPWYA